MITSVVVRCSRCQAPNTVVARSTVSYNGGRVPTFDEPKCNVCHRWLHPSPDEWAKLLQTMIDAGMDVPPRWWDNFAWRNPPVASTA